MEIKSLNDISFDVTFNAFSRAFADYDFQQNKDQLKNMLARRGFVPSLSFAAFEQGEIISFTFNGIGTFNDVPTAYDTGTGTLPDFRGKGIATKIFEYSLPYLQEAGVRQYLLEVLQHNSKAVSVYSNLGFEVTREFNYSMQESLKINNKVESTLPYTIRHIDIREVHSMASFCDFTPSWQNSFESIGRAAAKFIGLGVFDSGRLAGYCFFEPLTGDIAQIAVAKPYRRKGIGSLMLGEIIRLDKCGAVKIINTDVSCESMAGFLESKNIPVRGKQFEMIKKL